MTFGEDPPRESGPGHAPGPARSGVEEDRDAESRDEDEGRIGIFGSWRSLYVTVILYTAALTVLLYVLTRLLDFSS